MGSTAARNTLIALLSVVIGVLLVAVGFLGRVVTEPSGETAALLPTPAPAAADGASDTIDYGVIGEILDILDEDFVEPDRIDRQLLFEGAINGIFEVLGDPHSTYIDPDSYALSRSDISGTFQGIGATVSKEGDFIVIVAPLPDTPAQRAGIRPGDIILEVDGEAAEGWALDKAVLKIRGPQGTPVELLIRHTDGTEERITITRDEITVASVDDRPIDLLTGRTTELRDAEGNEVTDIGYIRISQFTRLTPQELTDMVGAAEARGVRGLILDLRGNPGGLLVETAETANMFLNEGLILIQVDRDGTERTIEARSGTVTDLPLVIVQDQFSASGSELLAAALSDNGRATVVGTTSFGKGTVNHARELSNGGAVYVSIARFLTPARAIIEGLGVQPDVEIAPTADDFEAGRDVALLRAIDVLRGEAGMVAGQP